MGKKSVTWEKQTKRLKTAREGDIAIAVLCLIACVVWVGLSQLIYLAEAYTCFMSGESTVAWDRLRKRKRYASGCLP